MNRRCFIVSTAAVGLVAGSIPATAASDPMLSLLNRYREVNNYLNASPMDDDEEVDAYCVKYIDPIRDEIAMHTPAITSQAGVRESIRAVLKEQSIANDFEHSLLKSALAYLDGVAS